MTAVSLGRLRESARPWLDRPGYPRPREVRVVDSADRADLVVLDQILADAPALADLQTALAEHYGAAELVKDLWMAAYSRDPQLADASEVEAGQRAGRAIAAAMLGSPEHEELRRTTVGDPYAAAVSVLAQGPALRRMLNTLDTERRQREAHRAHQRADRAAGAVREAFAAAAEAAESAVDGEPDEEPDEEFAVAAPGEDGGDGGGVDAAEVPHPLVVDVQRAIAEAEALDAEAAAADAAAAGQNESGELAVAQVRADAREAAADADAELAAEATAVRAWGVGEAEWQRLDAGERMRLAGKLRGGKLAAFAALIGRFKQMAAAQRSHRVEHARGEYVGVTLGDDLGSLVPDEFVNLALPALRVVFAVRFAEERLMVFEQRGEEHEGQGAVIALIDCSHSMKRLDGNGITREAYAKALALALLDQARAATPARDFAAIAFSKQPEPAICFPASGPVRLEDKVAMAETFPGGGTDFQSPLDAAVELLEADYNTTGRRKADLVFITDGIAAVEEDWLRDWRAVKKRLGFRCFGVAIGDEAEPEGVLEEICDDVRQIEDLTDTRATADLFRAI